MTANWVDRLLPSRNRHIPRLTELTQLPQFIRHRAPIPVLRALLAARAAASIVTATS